MNKKYKSFSDFTNIYSLSKTLRFELVPVGGTQELLNKEDISGKGRIRKEKYEKTKPFINKLHREFVDLSLSDLSIESLQGYAKVYFEWKKDKKNKKLKKELEKQQKNIFKEIGEAFDIQGKKWALEFSSILEIKLKKKNKDVLFEEGVFGILKDKYKDEKDAFVSDKEGNTISIFDDWKGFIGYFNKFFETRKNFYKTDGTSTAIATRIVDNFNLFLDNLEEYRKVKNKLNQSDLSEIEENFSVDISQIFEIEYYNKLILQHGIDKYNLVLGGQTLTDGEKQKGFNELINKYRQDTGEKISFLKKFQKQILSASEKFLDEIENTEELSDVLKLMLYSYKTHILPVKKLFEDFHRNYEQYDLENIYINSFFQNTLIQSWIAIKGEFIPSLYDVVSKKDIKQEYSILDQGGVSMDAEKTKFPDFLKLSHIKKSLDKIAPTVHLWKERYYENKIINDEQSHWQSFLDIYLYEFSLQFSRQIIDTEGKEKTVGLLESKKALEDLLKNSGNSKSNSITSNESKYIIKEYADDLLRTYQIAKYFALEKKRHWLSVFADLDTAFYYDDEQGYFDKFYENAFEDIVQPYNKVRNYLTKKRYEEDKWKLNFNKSNLLNGWPDSPPGNTQYGGFIFRRKSNYFLGITDYPKIFDKKLNPDAYVKDGSMFEKMIYKQIDAKTLYGSVYIGLFGTKYSEDIEKLDDKILLQRMREILMTRVKSFPKFEKFIKNIDKGNYSNSKDLAREISSESFYSLSFVPISENFIKKGLYSTKKDKKPTKKLFLFQIKNKDWNKKASGRKNLHTLYFESIFSKENADSNFPIKLNGQAELFFRPKTKDLSEESIVTEENKIEIKKDNKTITHKKRFLEDKYFFHVPTTLNRTQTDSYYFNRNLNEFLANNKDINIIGLDRGEKHLIYYSVINQKGEVIESGSFNEINGKNYAKLLEEKAENREKARRDWQKVEQIKDLKKGYLSLVVRKVADLAIKYNAIIIMEDLNMRFKQIRGGIEKSVYQQFEKTLIDKLSYLVNKGEKDPEKAGNLLKAYQLSAPFDSFQKMGKQTGIIFYTQASYTSRIDPLTGWRPNIYLSYSNKEKAKKDIEKFQSIVFNKEKNRFEFTYDLANFYNKKGKINFPKKRVWTLCSNVERYRWDRNLNNNKGGYIHYEDLTTDFKSLFSQHDIDISENILNQIKKTENAKFLRDFIYFFRLVCQIRNTNNDEKTGQNENDFILSPVEPFFDSRKSFKFGENLPKNGDENGAYNIARKGQIILKKISDWKNENGDLEKIGWKEMYVSHIDWDDFATKK